MIDFFDEDFPLTKKQAELAKQAALEAEEAKKKQSESSEETYIEEATAVEYEMPVETKEEQTEAVETESYEAGPADEVSEKAAEVEAEAVEIEEEATEEEEISEEAIEMEAEATEAEKVPEEAVEVEADIEIPEEIPVEQPAASEQEQPETAPEVYEVDSDVANDQTSENPEDKLIDQLRLLTQMTSESEPDEAEESDSDEFAYEYDNRYFAEEETPAYKYPELYKNSRKKPTVRKKAKKNDNITISTKTLLKVGAVAAATAAAIKLLSKKDN